MLKRLISVLLVLAVMVPLLVPAMAAAPQASYCGYSAVTERRVNQIVDTANARIEALVEHAQAKADRFPLLSYFYARTLVYETELIARVAIARCEALGADVECVYEPVTVGRYTVYIDPLRVISFG